MIDTHCHLNFSAFKKNVDEVVVAARSVGVKEIIVPGTDVKRSRKAVEVAGRFEGVYAAVGIHPHHVYNYLVQSAESEVRSDKFNAESDLAEIEVLLKHEKVVAVGEVGLDRHTYEITKYGEYKVGEEFVDLQKEIFRRQVELAIKYNKSVIIHNREAKSDLLSVLESVWSDSLRNRAVLHCCEPDYELYEFAKDKGMYLGVDGDITFYKEKQEFWKKITNNGHDLSMIVLETDAPFLLPEPYRSQKLFPNKPERIKDIAMYLSDLLSVAAEELVATTSKNAVRLFNL